MFHNCFTYVSPVSHQCLSIVSPVSHHCLTTVSTVFYLCCIKIITATQAYGGLVCVDICIYIGLCVNMSDMSPVYHQCFTSISPVFHQCFISVSPLFHQCFTRFVLKSSQLPEHMEGSFVLISAHIYAFVCVCLTCHK